MKQVAKQITDGNDCATESIHLSYILKSRLLSSTPLQLKEGTEDSQGSLASYYFVRVLGAGLYSFLWYSSGCHKESCFALLLLLCEHYTRKQGREATLGAPPMTILVCSASRVLEEYQQQWHPRQHPCFISRFGQCRREQAGGASLLGSVLKSTAEVLWIYPTLQSPFFFARRRAQCPCSPFRKNPGLMPVLSMLIVITGMILTILLIELQRSRVQTSVSQTCDI